MSALDCIRLLGDLDSADAVALEKHQQTLIDSGVPVDDAWTQAAELVMEDVLAERNALAGEVAENGGFLQTLDIEHLLNPDSYANSVLAESLKDEISEFDGDIMEMDTAEKARLNELKQQLPSQGEEAAAAKARLQKRVADRKRKGQALRRGAEKRKQGRRVREWLKKPLRRLQGRVPVEIHDSHDEVDFEVPSKAAGYKHEGQVHLFTDFIRDQKEAVLALEHEAIGHLGLEGALGHRKFNELLGDVTNLLVEIMMDPGAHPEISKILTDLRKYYVDKDGKYNLSVREEAREILAHIAHSKPRLGRMREIYNKVVNWVKQWAAKVGLADPDMAHIESLIVKATDYVTTVESPAVDTERGAAAILQPPNEPEPDDNVSDTERELYAKLGLEARETSTLIQKIRAAGWKGIKQTSRDAHARGYEGLFDGLIEVKRAEEKLGVGLGKEALYLDPKGVRKKTHDYEGSAYVAMRLATGISDMMTHLLHYGSLEWRGGIVSGVDGSRGFLEVLGELGNENLNDWLVWMGAHRGEELMAQGREHNLDPEMIRLGKTKNAGNEALFDKIKKEYNAMNKRQLDFAEEAGLIQPDKRAEWESDWYVPFYRQTDDDIAAGPRTKRGLSHQSAGIRYLLGRDLPTQDLLENILTNWIKLTDASVKNHALKLMLDNFKDSPLVENETAKFQKAMVPKTEIHKLVRQNKEFAVRLADWLDLPLDTTADGVIDALNDLDKQGLEEVWQVVAPKDPDIVRVQRNGKNEYYRVNSPGLLRATGHMSQKASQNMGITAGRLAKRLLTTLVTTSPDFMLRNFIRDAMHSWAINKDNMWVGVDAFRGLKKAVTEDPIHRAMMAAGASFQGGYVHGTDPDQTTQIMRRELEKAGLSKTAIEKYMGSLILTPAKLEAVIRSNWQKYRSIGDKIENANRIATAEAGRKAGKPDAQWLFESKDLMDYSRRGNFASLMAFTDVMPFLNARMQGVDKLFRAARDDPKVMKVIPSIVGKKVLYIGMLSVGIAMLNDDDDRYQELPDWEKDAYWHFWLHDGHYRIPKPFEIGFIAGTMPERMYRAWYTDTQPNKKVLWALQHGIFETLNINYGIPQAILPLFEVMANRKLYFDQPIETLSDQKVLPKERYNQYTSETAIALGNTQLAEWLRLSPKQLQHLWNGYTGTMGAYALQSTDMMMRGALDLPSAEAIKPHDVPLMKSIYQGDRQKTTQWQVEFYDRMKEVQELFTTLQKFRKNAELEKFKKFTAEHKEKLKYRKVFEAGGRQFSILRKQRERILASDTLNPQEKYQKSQAIQAKINQLAKRLEERTRAPFD